MQQQHPQYQQQPRHVLFFSSYCPYCNDVLTLLTKKNVREMFTCISVDQHRDSIPTFVDSVPIIVTVAREILKDGAVISFVEACGSQVHGEEVDVLPTDTCDGTMADSFAYLDDSVSSYGKGFVPVDFNPRIYAGQDDDVTSTQNGKRKQQQHQQQQQHGGGPPGFDSMIDKLRMERDNDIDSIRRGMGGPNPLGLQ